jgi:hypothetical protein
VGAEARGRERRGIEDHQRVEAMLLSLAFQAAVTHTVDAAAISSDDAQAKAQTRSAAQPEPVIQSRRGGFRRRYCR